jgi:hypothetical protein
MHFVFRVCKPNGEKPTFGLSRKNRNRASFVYRRTTHPWPRGIAESRACLSWDEPVGSLPNRPFPFGWELTNVHFKTSIFTEACFDTSRSPEKLWILAIDTLSLHLLENCSNISAIERSCAPV